MFEGYLRLPVTWAMKGASAKDWDEGSHDWKALQLLPGFPSLGGTAAAAQKSCRLSDSPLSVLRLETTDA